ncbi:MAG: hypothetical protein ACI9CA_002050 [Natronomonas sp.]|jgi:hypothetical protein
MNATEQTESGRESETLYAIVNPEPNGEYRDWALVVANKPTRALADGSIITGPEHAFYTDAEEAADDLELHHEKGNDHLTLRKVEVSGADPEEVCDR